MDIAYFLPTKIITGPGAMTGCKDELAALGRRALIVTGRSSAERSGALPDAVELLDGLRIQYEIFREITANPLLSDCERAGKQAAAMKADFLLAIGGGSVLDAAKAAAIYAANPQVRGEAIYDLAHAHPALPLVAVGITAGTGSEVTPYAVITVDRTGKKRSITHRDCYPVLAVGDPKYTATLPYSQTVSTALDALSHAIEGWFSPKANDLTDQMARRAVPLLWGGLCELSSEDKAITSRLRERLYYGSLYAGMVLNHCSTGFPHPLGYPLTERFGIPHGKACAAFLPDLAKRGAAFDDQRGRELWEMLGCTPDAFDSKIRLLADLPSIAVTEELLCDCYGRWENCKNFKNSPGGLTREEALSLFRRRLS